MKRVVFVCVENANRSQMAEAFAHMAGGIQAYSAGSRPSGVVNRQAVEAMAEVGYDLSAHRSKSLDDLPGRTFDVVVMMGCGDACPTLVAPRREEWNIPDPKQMPREAFRAVRDLIRTKVNQLVQELKGDCHDHAG
jgi:protein-tyrosine-phosphatase